MFCVSFENDLRIDIKDGVVIYKLVLRTHENLSRIMHLRSKRNIVKIEHVSFNHSYLYATANSTRIPQLKQQSGRVPSSFIKYKFYNLISNSMSMKYNHRPFTRCRKFVFQQQIKGWQN